MTPAGVHFRVWAPKRKDVQVVLGGKKEHTVRLEREKSGYWSAEVPGLKAGALYKFELDGDGTFPDPAARFQPEGPHNWSQVVDPATFKWTDQAWKGVPRVGQVIYEMHVGAFTPEGTWKAASEKLQYLADTGITVLEVLPVCEFPGTFGWGYDGVHLFAPTRLYGTPDDFRAFVDRAHAHGLGIVLDVVYNHFGPDGNYLAQFSPHYFTDRHETDWGAAINFDTGDCGPVREFVIANAVYWIDEFHLDGLRLDATQNIYDDSKDHILAALVRAAREAAGARSTLYIAENEPQHTILVRPPSEGGYGIDMLWNDDYHHTAMVALTGHHEAYYTDYRGSPQEFISAAKYGYLFQGQWYKWQQQRRGTPTFGLRPETFINFIQNHDQVANSARGLRCRQLSDPGTFKAITALTLLSPGTPMLFFGQEFGSSDCFYYFADHKPELAQLVHEGRIEFMKQFESVATPEMRGSLPRPEDPKTFEQSKLDWSDLKKNQQIYDLHRDLLKLRRSETVFSGARPLGMDGAVIGEHAFVFRYFGDGDGDRLVLVNLGMDLCFDPSPEPLLAPPANKIWTSLWSTEDPRYGGTGTPPLDSDYNWRLPGRSAVVLSPQPAPKPRKPRAQSKKDVSTGKTRK